MIRVLETDHLFVDEDGTVWLERASANDDPARLGPLGDDPGWPARLGFAPPWYQGELESLRIDWAELAHDEVVSQWRQDYYQSLGDFARYPWTPL